MIQQDLLTFVYKNEFFDENSCTGFQIIFIHQESPGTDLSAIKIIFFITHLVGELLCPLYIVLPAVTTGLRGKVTL